METKMNVKSESGWVKSAWAMLLSAVFAAACAAVLPGAAVAGPIPDYGLDWVTIGSPGNRAATPAEAPGFFDANAQLHIGTVNYEYRLTRTEITAKQWHEFVVAYLPHYDESQTFDPVEFTGGWSRPTDADPSVYWVPEPVEQMPVSVGWRMAARYANWLHNDKRTDVAAFASGVYDTSTFTRNPDGSYNDQLVRSPGAKFWIPNLDEWTKGMHYDPHRNGPDQEGYWRYPTTSDTAPIPGYPVELGGNGTGQTSASLHIDSGSDRVWVPVGSYPDVQSPWGLLDGSGGWSEWTETSFGLRSRVLRGSSFWGITTISDPIESLFSGASHAGRHGLRLASAVPGPGSACLLLVSCCLHLSRSRRRSRTCVGDAPLSHSPSPSDSAE